MNFHIVLLVDAIFNAINNLLELYEYALMSITANCKFWCRQNAEDPTWQLVWPYHGKTL